MTLPSSIDWTPTYLAALPLAWQGGTGDCTAEAATMAMEMRAIIQGYPARQLSPLFNYWWNQGGPGGIHDVGGADSYNALVAAMNHGVCLESLWPSPAWMNIDTTTMAYRDATFAAVRATPTAAAMLDGPNQTLLDFVAFDFNGSIAQQKLRAQIALAAGYTLICFVPPQHEVCCWGYENNCDTLIGLDSRSQNPQPYHLAWGNIQPTAIIRDVYFANATKGTPLIVSPPITTPPPLPLQTVNTPMLNDIITIAQDAIKAGKITKQQKDAGSALWAALVPDITNIVVGPPVTPPPVTPPPVLPPTPTPAGALQSIGKGGAFTSSKSQPWSIHADNSGIYTWYGFTNLKASLLVELADGTIQATGLDGIVRTYTTQGWNPPLAA